MLSFNVIQDGDHIRSVDMQQLCIGSLNYFIVQL